MGICKKFEQGLHVRNVPSCEARRLSETGVIDLTLEKFSSRIFKKHIVFYKCERKRRIPSQDTHFEALMESLGEECEQRWVQKCTGKKKKGRRKKEEEEEFQNQNS